MRTPSRRRFLLVLGSLIPVPLVARRLHRAAVADLDPVALRAVARVLLPSELGDPGMERVVSGFEQWLAGYREGAELLHGYGTGVIRTTGPSPALRWNTQLRDLAAAARSRHGVSIDHVPMAEREGLVREALAGVRLANLLQFDRAPHITLGLLGYFYASPEANDLCYQARIGAMSCRRLDRSPAKPLPLAGAG